MKRTLVTMGSAALLAALAGCFSGSGEEVESEEGALTGSELDDTVATVLLGGACDVRGLGKTRGTRTKCPTKLSEIVDALPQDKLQTFVVSEQGDMPKEGASYRFVISAGTDEEPLFVATVGGPEMGEGGVEAMGWSKSLQAYAYYKVEGGAWVRKGDGTQVKSTTRGREAAFECINCHNTGAPLMKEIHDGWGNWHSNWFSMPAPEGANALFKKLFDKKTIADTLERKIIPAIRLHSKGRVDRAKKEGQLRGVLTQLMCEVGEPSIIAAHSSNSSGRMGKVSTFNSMLPGAIMINQLLVPPRTGGTGVELGLEQSLSLEAPSLRSLSVDSAAYSKAIEDNGQTIGGQPGDTITPMSAPEKSHVDLDAVQELLRQKLIDNDIVGDILMTDFTVPMFSEVRCKLADTLPATWKDADELRKSWSTNLESSKLVGAKGLLARLKKTDDTKDHAATLETFAKACAARAKPEFTADVMKIMSQRRVEFEQRYHSVVESDWLIPRDNLGSQPFAIRFNATSCEIEEQSEPLAGNE
jgi:hypothetical protein